MEIHAKRSLPLQKINTKTSLTETCANKPEVKILLEILRKANTNAYFHSYHVSEIVEEMINRSCKNYSEEEIEAILIGALLHDIGKIFVPLNLTQMEAVLSQNEKDIVETHVLTSFEIVSPVFPKIVQDICLLHHERVNGTGYPRRCPLSDLPDYVLMVQVADIFDALTAPRVYKEPYKTDKALEIMKKEAEQLKMDDFYFTLLTKIVQEKGDM